MGDGGLGHLREQNRYPIAPDEAGTQHQIRCLIGQSADVGECIFDVLAGRGLMYQSEARGLMRPLIAYVYADVIQAGYVPRERSCYLLEILRVFRICWHINWSTLFWRSPGRRRALRSGLVGGPKIGVEILGQSTGLQCSRLSARRYMYRTVEYQRDDAEFFAGLRCPRRAPAS